MTLTLSTMNKFFCIHSFSWCCMTIPGLVTKFSVVQKISSRQIFTNILNFRCDLDLERSNPIFPQDTSSCGAVLSNQVYLQMDQLFRRYSKNSHILIIKALAVILIYETANQFFCMQCCNAHNQQVRPRRTKTGWWILPPGLVCTLVAPAPSLLSSSKSGILITNQ